MLRSLCSFLALLSACAAMSAPAPRTLPAGLGTFEDPNGDCKLRRGKDALIIEIPGGDHDYDPQRERENAPRLLRELEGDFTIQFRVRIDSPPPFEASFYSRPATVAGGLLLIPPEGYAITCYRLDFGIAGRGIGAYGYAALIAKNIARGQMNAIWPSESKNWPLPRETDRAYLRLQRRGKTLYPYLSPDGEKWTSLLGGGGFTGLPAKLKVGLAAYSTSSDSSKVIFDEIKLIPPNKREPWEFTSGWGKPVDPDKDCNIQCEKDSLTIEMPGREHDYDPLRKRFNAPRLLSELEGNFDLQVRVRIDYRPSAHSTVEGQPPFVSAGFLLIYPEASRTICERVEFAVSQQGSNPNAYAVAPRLPKPRRPRPPAQGKEAEGYAVTKCWYPRSNRKDGRRFWDHEMATLINRLWERGWTNWPLPVNAKYAYLRLEQRDESFFFSISPDGKKWTTTSNGWSLPAKGKLALAAYSTSTEPSKVRFDQLKLWRDKKK